MTLHQHQQRFCSIAAETGDDMHMSRRYTTQRKRTVHIMGQSAAVPHCCTASETHIRQLEKDAYTSVLRAFKIRADSISWERESLITNLRQELGLSNDEHGEILQKINTENFVQGIRKSCRACGDQYGIISMTNMRHNIISNGNANGAQYRQSKKHSRGPHQSLGLLSAFNQHSSLTNRRNLLKFKNHRNSPTGNIQLDNDDPEMTTLPHYFTPSGENTSLAPQFYSEGAGRGVHIRNSRPKSDFLKVPGGSGHDTLEIKIRVTDDLLRTVKSNHSVNRVFSGRNVDPYTIGDAKEVLKEHEKALIHVLDSLADVSDDE